MDFIFLMVSDGFGFALVRHHLQIRASGSGKIKLHGKRPGSNEMMVFHILSLSGNILTGDLLMPMCRQRQFSFIEPTSNEHECP
jgi:hypothetical protein